MPEIQVLSDEQQEKNSIALAFIMKNEGRYAIQMIESVAGLVDFVAVHDTGSVDNSVELVRQTLVAANIPHAIDSAPFTRFDEARNRALQLVPPTIDWILMLDADEILLSKDFPKLRELVDQTEIDAWLLPRFNWSDAIWGSLTKDYPDWQGRLFQNKSNIIKYRRAVHEELIGYNRIDHAHPKKLQGDTHSYSLHIHHVKLFIKKSEEIHSRHHLYNELLPIDLTERAAMPKMTTPAATPSIRFDQTNIPMKHVRKNIVEQIWKGKDPFADKSVFQGRVDFQGWASDNPLLTRAINEVRPSVVVEIGVWKGGSVMTMAAAMKELGLDGAVIAIDTWLGAWDHWIQPEWFDHLSVEAGYPSLYKTFAANICERNLENYVVPLPLDSINAAVVMRHYAIRPDVLHIDGGHDFDAVMADLRSWWPLLNPGGVLIGDDYHPSGETWPTVRQAFHEFFKTEFIANLGGKCYIRKEGE
jgi:glycosyltransferase involved in cell wall biosynthesis